MKQALGAIQIILMCLTVMFPVIGLFGAVSEAMVLVYFISTAVCIGCILAIKSKLEELND